MDSLGDDIRFALRKLAKNPGFLSIALLSLALGIGANTTVFSLIDAVLLRPLPVYEPERLVAVYSSTEDKPYRSSTYAEVIDYAHPEVFSGLAATCPWEFSLATEMTSQLLTGELASANYFEVLGVPPALGRGLAPSSPEVPAAVAVISHSLWTRAFGADPQAVGKTVRLNGRPFTISGVAPEGFKGPNLASRSEIWVPLGNYSKVATGFWSHFEAVSYAAQRALDGDRIAMWELLGRLRPGVSLEQARIAMAALDLGLRERYPDTHKNQFATLVSASAAATPLTSRYRTTQLVLLLLAAVGAALLIACTNIANLLLVKADGRRQEIGIRLTVGASRRRLIRQLLTESLVLATLGGAAGLLVTIWAFDLLAPFRLPGGIRIGDLDLAIEPRVLTFAVVAALATGLLFGLAPALRSAGRDPIAVLRNGSATGSRDSSRLRFALVAAQVGLSVTLLIAAGLFARSLQQGLSAELGFDARGVLTMTFDLGPERYDEAQAEAWYSELLKRLRAMPSVRSASLSSTPFGRRGVGVTGLTIEGQGRLDSDRITLAKVEADYFKTLGIPFVAGRSFDPRDRDGGTQTLIINETMARTFWPETSAVGRRINFANLDSPFFEVVGVVADSHYWSLREEPQRYVYMPLAQHWSHAAGNETTLVVRTVDEPMSLAGPASRIVSDLDRQVPIGRIATLEDRVAGTLMPQRIGTLFFGFFSAMALVLATAGVFAVVAFSVSRRTCEIGLRVALGARPSEVSGLFLRRGLAPVALGLILGLVGAAAATRLIETFLYEVKPLDPTIFIGTSALFFAVAIVACWLPARAATRLDPTVALRHE